MAIAETKLANAGERNRRIILQLNFRGGVDAHVFFVL
jgi:hypothetical protein